MPPLIYFFLTLAFFLPGRRLLLPCNLALSSGSGHDYCCYNNGNCYANMDYDYDAPGSGYGSTASRNWAGGVYSWNGRSDLIEVYHTDA